MDRRRPLERGERHVQEVLGRVDDEVAHLAAVRPDLGRVLVRPVVDGHKVERATANRIFKFRIFNKRFFNYQFRACDFLNE